MKGYVAEKGNRYYAVIYEGLDPITGKEIRTWHAAGPDKSVAEKLAKRLGAEVEGRVDKTRSLTFGAYPTQQWLPGKANTLADSTWHGYRRKIERHILPSLGKIPIRRLKVDHLDSLYDSKLRPVDVGVKGLAPKTVLEIHQIIRGALNDAVKRGILTRNVAAVARHASRRRLLIRDPHRVFHRRPPVEDPGEVGLRTVEVLVSLGAGQDFLVAGAGFEPATFGL